MKMQDFMGVFAQSPDVLVLEKGQRLESLDSWRDEVWDYECLISERPEYAERVVERIDRKSRPYASDVLIVTLAA